MNSGEHIIDTLSTRSPAASVVANSDRSVILVRSFFPATEGAVETGSHLKLGVCVSGGGQVTYHARGRLQTWHWGRGNVLLTMPHDDSKFMSPDVDMIGLAVDLQTLAARRDSLPPGSLHRLSSQVMADNVIRSVLTALWTCAEYHGTSGAFIDEGIDIILQRLTMPVNTLSLQNLARPLTRRQLREVSDYILSRITCDIRVSELAAVIGMEPRRFSRALRSAACCAPYAYITAVRMKYAKERLDVGESVTDTALSVGYANPSKFSAAFYQTVGCTPSQWKARKS